MPSAAISFTDANGNECELVLIHGEPPTVLHPDCDGRALVDEWDELFACAKCLEGHPDRRVVLFDGDCGHAVVSLGAEPL